MYPIIIQALAERKKSKYKKVRDQAEQLSKILHITFVEILLGCRYIYRVIATTSSQVEQFPCEITKTLSDVVVMLSAMANNLDVSCEKAKVQAANLNY